MKGKPKIRYMGMFWDEYTPAVEGQMLRDCIVMLDLARHKYNEVVIVCERDEPDRMLAGLGMTRSPRTELARDWICYKVGPDWPSEPENTRLLVQRDLYQPKQADNLMVLDDQHTNGYYLPPQGRLAPDSISLLRPAPNGYVPTDPALIMLWT